jgi:hypothetical protein
VQRQFERDATAQRIADDGERAFDQLFDIPQMRERRRFQRAASEPSEIGREHAISRRFQGRDLGSPHVAVRNAGVQQQDGVAGLSFHLR